MNMGNLWMFGAFLTVALDLYAWSTLESRLPIALLWLLFAIVRLGDQYSPLWRTAVRFVGGVFIALTLVAIFDDFGRLRVLMSVAVAFYIYVMVFLIPLPDDSVDKAFSGDEHDH